MIEAANKKPQNIYTEFQLFASSDYKGTSILTIKINLQESDISENELILKRSFGKRPKIK
jgi:hypothetical protein